MDDSLARSDAQRQWDTWHRKRDQCLTRWRKRLDASSELTDTDRRRVYAVALAVARHPPETWAQIQTLFLALDPPYTQDAQRGARIGIVQKRQMFARQQGCCAYCDIELLSPDDPYLPPIEHREAQKAAQQILSEMQSRYASYDPKTGRLTEDMWHETAEYQRAKALDDAWQPVRVRRPNVEHVVPIRRGGNDRLDNLVLACYDCNQQKGLRTGEEFRRMPGDPISRLNALSGNMMLQTIADGIEYATLYPTVFAPLCEDLWALYAIRPRVPYPPPL
jgi:hypothetical protein